MLLLKGEASETANCPFGPRLVLPARHGPARARPIEGLIYRRATVPFDPERDLGRTGSTSACFDHHVKAVPGKLFHA